MGFERVGKQKRRLRQQRRERKRSEPDQKAALNEFAELGQEIEAPGTEEEREEPATIKVVRPTTEQFQANRSEFVGFMIGNDGLYHAVALLGREQGISMFLSGVTTELLRHLRIDEARSLLHQYADTMQPADDEKEPPRQV